MLNFNPSLRKDSAISMTRSSSQDNHCQLKELQVMGCQGGEELLESKEENQEDHGTNQGLVKLS